MYHKILEPSHFFPGFSCHTRSLTVGGWNVPFLLNLWVNQRFSLISIYILPACSYVWFSWISSKASIFVFTFPLWENTILTWFIMQELSTDCHTKGLRNMLYIQKCSWLYNVMKHAAISFCLNTFFSDYIKVLLQHYFLFYYFLVNLHCRQYYMNNTTECHV